MTPADRAGRNGTAAKSPRPRRLAGRPGAPSPRSLRVRCPAKVNLGLWILGRRADGYHEVDTVLHAIDLEDELTLARRPKAGLTLEVSGRPIPAGGPNLVERAWAQLRTERPELANAGLHVTLRKRIPIGAGLGGGSSDAAGLLAGASALFDLGLSDAQLEAVGAPLGADVPFFFRGGAARATGRGDRLRHLRPLPPTWGVLVSPPVAVSTSWAYGLLRKRLTPPGSDASILASFVAHGDVGAAIDARFNAFEDAVLPQIARLESLLRSLVAAGAWGALMTGSGSSLYTLARSEKEARAVANAVRACDAEVRVMRTRERGVTVSPVG